MSGACSLADCWRSIDFNEGFYLSCSTRFPSNRRTQSRTSTGGISVICTFLDSAFYSPVIPLEDNKSPRFNVTCTHNQFYKFFHTSSPPCNRVIHGHYRVVNVNSRQSSWSYAAFAQLLLQERNNYTDFSTLLHAIIRLHSLAAFISSAVESSMRLFSTGSLYRDAIAFLHRRCCTRNPLSFCRVSRPFAVLRTFLPLCHGERRKAKEFRGSRETIVSIFLFQEIYRVSDINARVDIASELPVRGEVIVSEVIDA